MKSQSRVVIDAGSCRHAIAIAALLALVVLPVFAQDPNDPDRLANSGGGAMPSHMPEALRESIDKVVIVSGRGAARENVDGSYGKSTPGLVGGMASGSDMATISREIGGVPVNIPIPGMQIPAAIFGGIAGVTMREMQEFRDALTEELLESDSPPLRSDGLAIDAFWTVRRLPEIDSTLINPGKAIPAGADAVLYTDFGELAIDVDGSDAVITTSVVATLREPESDRELYRTVIRYQDRDTLGNWTADDNALWHRYSNFARYYLGRAAAADVFGHVDLTASLTPVGSADTKPGRKNPGRLETDSTLPTLAWQLELDGGEGYGEWTDGIDESAVAYDLEIFDDRQLVYDAQDLPDPAHRLDYELEPCRTYRWSVRPVFSVEGKTRFGDWMRFAAGEEDGSKGDAGSSANGFGKGLKGRAASVAPAYTQDFAELEVACRR